MKTFENNFFQNPLQIQHELTVSVRDSGSLEMDYASVCCPSNELPAQEQPGNFVEKHSFPNGRVVFAIGDTGVLRDPLPALCVRHYLRRGVTERSTNPVIVTESINQLIYDCCAATSSLSCFYAEYKMDKRILRYVNAGHDVPILVRTNPDQVLRLDAGGPVFGLRESVHYAEGVVPIRKGDRLVAFTQGVVDSLASHKGGAENALISLARSRMNTSAFQLAQRIVAECESTRSGRRLEKSALAACFGQPASAPTACLHAVAGYHDKRFDAMLVPA